VLAYNRRHKRNFANQKKVQAKEASHELPKELPQESVDCPAGKSPIDRDGLLPLVEQPYDQAKLNLVKNEIKKIYKEKGIAVGAESVLNSTSTPRYVEVFIEVYKL
jgi:hypothetical protein